MPKKQASARIRVSERALLQRINRKLKQDGEQLRTARSDQAERDAGRYYLVNVKRNSIQSMHVQLEKLGRELGVMQPWEELAH